VKVLDFGLAKAMEPVAGALPSMSISPTITTPAMTQAGMILGTAAYMSPEQAKGRPADKRSDVWAFGCVLYELLTGERAFKGEDVADTMAQVLTKEPDIARAPRRVQTLLRRCLEKDPKKRLRDISEVPFLIDSAPEPSVDRRGPLNWVAVALALVFFAAATTLALVHFREPPPTRRRVQFQVPPPEGRTFSQISFSPDGRRLAFVAYDKNNRASLWVHSLDSGTSRQLVATIMGASPFWSPDSEAIGFIAEERVKTITVSGGLAQTVCAMPPGTAWGAGAWNNAGVILFGNQFGSLYSVPARGGQPTAITALDATRHETGHTAPSFLPDGRHFLYMRRSRDPDLSGVYVGSLDARPNTQPVAQIARTDSNPQFTPLTDPRFGSLLLVRDGTLLAQRFDVGALEVSGEAIPIAEQVSLSGTTYAAYTASSEGSVALRTSGETTISRLTRYDIRGNVLGYASEPDDLRDLSLSPDGTRIAVDRSETRGTDIHLLDTKRGTNQRLTTDPEIDRTAVWSPEGNRIVFSSGRDGAGTLLNLYLKNADSSGKEELLLASPRAKYANSWSHDGYLLFSAMTPGNRSDLMYLAVDGDRTPKPYVAGPFNESQGQFSPDGRWVAYTSDESGTNQIYLSPFPNPESKTTISNNGGFAPRWAHDGKQLYYISQDLALMEVDISPSLGPGIPRSLFTTRLWGGVGLNGFRWDVAPDGAFIIGDALDKAVGPPITVILNWTGALGK
jgi:Tol biopolymer transport system component